MFVIIKIFIIEIQEITNCKEGKPLYINWWDILVKFFLTSVTKHGKGQKIVIKKIDTIILIVFFHVWRAGMQAFVPTLTHIPLSIALF